MSWDKEKPLQSDKTPQKSSYVQVPSSSPIHIKSSPNKSENNNIMPPSRTQLNNTTSNTDKEKAIERKRQLIREHVNFPMVRKKFHYLSDSDIYRGFVLGKGNLREVNQWLTENFDKDAIVAKQEALKREEQASLKKKRDESNRELLIKQSQEQERRRKLQQEQDANQEQSQREDAAKNYDDEDVSPIKVRGKARLKSNVSSQPAPRLGSLSSAGHGSTRVQLEKPKMSILEKYKQKPRSQVLIDHMLKRDNQDEEVRPRKRRLVRGTANESQSSRESTSSSLPSMKDLSAKFNYKDSSASRFAKEEEDDGIVDDDDLDKIEEKIKENTRRKAKAKQEKAIDISDEELEEEAEESDNMSDEDDESSYNTGLTSIDSQVLEFLNNATSQDIVEIANIVPSIANILISKRPFSTIYQISEENFEDPNAESNGDKKRRGGQRKTVGLKIIESTEFSLKGYKAVDSLVKQCSEYGDLISQQMTKWGVTVTGEGELEIVDINGEDLKDSDQNAEEEDEDDVIVVQPKRKGLAYIAEKPPLLAEDIDLKNYQLVGINWLNLLYHNKLSCILADEMGLGKTCQVIAFMSHLKESTEEKDKGPHLVVVPSSTLENWLREFQKFCPDIVVQAYYGSQSERESLRYDLQNEHYDVLVTTYNLATGAAPDFKFLKNHNFNMIVYDEGHMLKNSGSERYIKLMKLKARFRLLLTGTPLQNNLKELVSLLAFMLPNLFNEKRDDLQGLFSQKVSIKNEDSNYNPLLSIQAITKAKTMMTPFVLRRKKVQVLKHLPAKTHEVVYCDLHDSQKQIYDKYLSQGKATRLERIRRKTLVGKEIEKARQNPIPSSSNVMMSLRKASMHPLLFRFLYTDAKLKQMAKAIMEEPEYVEANQKFILEDMSVMSDYELNNLCEKFPKTLKKFILKDSEYLNSGKVNQLIEVLEKIIIKKEKVLVFSLFTQMLDILEKVLTISHMKFIRLDGQTTVDTRQDLIDTFYDDETIPVFLLSTKAGGFGINLVAANHVIIFDQSFNPHDDKQAEDRAHRVGQTNEVIVTKLITKNTIEENMLQLAENKLQLDQSISGSDISDTKFEEKAASMFEKLIFDT